MYPVRTPTSWLRSEISVSTIATPSGHSDAASTVLGRDVKASVRMRQKPGITLFDQNALDRMLKALRPD